MVVAAAALWGSLGVFGKLLYARGITPLEVASIRAAVGFVALAVWLLPRPSSVAVKAGDLPRLALVGIGAFALFSLLFFATVERTTVGVAAALLYTAPGWVVLMAWALDRERPGRIGLSALGLVLLGVALVTGAARSVLAGGAPLGAAAIALGLGSGLTYGLFTVLGKRLLSRYAPLPTTFYTFGFAALALGLLAPPWGPPLRDPGSIPLLLLMGLLPTLAAYVLYFEGLRRMRAGSAAMLATTEPVVAALLGAALLGDALSADRVAGVALIVAAALLVARRGRAVTPAPPPAAPAR